MNVTITDFSQCHARIISQLMKFCSLPSLMDQTAAARMLAQESLLFFRQAVLEHHTKEERELFPAVLAHAAQGREREEVQSLAERLTREHRLLELRWFQMEPSLTQIAQGEAFDLDAAPVETLVLDYAAHAAFEEAEFLPLCQTILSRSQKNPTLSDLSHHGAWAPTAPAAL